MNNRSRFTSLLVAAIVLTTLLSVAWGGADGYNSTQKYEGKYKQDMIYYRYSDRSNWHQAMNGTYPQNVLCKDALRSFSTKGKWLGHFSKDGSCSGTVEPAEFAVGNRLNFDDAFKSGR